jgi:hypothetical protein
MHHLRRCEICPETEDWWTNLRRESPGRSGWEQQLDQNKQRLVTEWIQRTDFKAKYNELSNAQYVDTLNANTGNSLTQAERDHLVFALQAFVPTLTRADVLRIVAENEEFRRKEFNSLFVLMQYFGYLRRNADLPGYQFWLNKLNQFGGDFRGAEMVKAFITSAEYRSRFRSNWVAALSAYQDHERYLVG